MQSPKIFSSHSVFSPRIKIALNLLLKLHQFSTIFTSQQCHAVKVSVHFDTAKLGKILVSLKIHRLPPRNEHVKLNGKFVRLARETKKSIEQASKYVIAFVRRHRIKKKLF